MATTKKERAPTFERGDRVKIWGKDAGIVEEVWFEGAREMVSVVWEVSGCVSDVRAYQLQFAPLPTKATA